MDKEELFSSLFLASREFKFCKLGLAGLNNAADKNSVSLCVKLLREQILSCFKENIHDFIAQNIELWNEKWKAELNAGGIWVNEVPGDKPDAIIIAADNTNSKLISLLCFKNQRVFVFGDAKVYADMNEHSKIYSKSKNLNVGLYHSSVGYIYNSKSDILLHDDCVLYADNATRIRLYCRSTLFLTPTCKFKNFGCKKIEPVAAFGIS
nr:MAG TPA: hypothetical protein [Caudoviricetes sp.]